MSAATSCNPLREANDSAPVTRFLLALLLIFMLAGVSGCGHYQLGRSGQVSFSRLYIAPVQSDVIVPQAVALVERNLVEAFIDDSTVEVVNRSQADAVLEVTLTRFDKGRGVASRKDTALARSFDVRLGARVRLIRASDGTPLMESDGFVVSQQVYAERGYPQAEYNNMPVLSEKLARDIHRAVTSVW